MFAERTKWKLRPNLISKQLERLKHAKKSMIDLSESNPTRCGFSYLKDELLKPFKNAQNLAYTPDPKGMLAARKVISEDYAEKKLHVKLEQIFLTASTSESYSVLFKLLLNPGERILAPRPSYPLFDFLAGLNNVKLDHYQLDYDGEWFINFESIERAWQPTTKALVLVHPNNPTGSFVKRRELEWVLRFARRKSIALISDEVFFDFPLTKNQEQALPLVAKSEALCFSLGGLSKSLGLPQMKLGWIAANGPKPVLKQAAAKLEFILDTYLSVNTPVQNAMREWFRNRKQIQDEIRGRVQCHYALLRKICDTPSPVNVLSIEGGWYGVLRIPRLCSEEQWVLRFLKEDQVLVQPGYFYDFPNEAFIVVSLIPETDIFQKGILKVLRRIQDETSAK